MLKPFLEIGEIVTTHGVMGEVKIYPWCDEPEVLCELPRLYLADGAQPREILQARVHKNMCLVLLEGVEGMDAARRLVGRTVWAARADLQLEPGRYFVQDILGCEVRDADTGKVYGVVTSVDRPGPQDIYTVKAPNGREYLFPGVDAFLKERNPPEGYITVTPIPGLLDDGAASEREDG